jgi:hypothetical protein
VTATESRANILNGSERAIIATACLRGDISARIEVCVR